VKIQLNRQLNDFEFKIDTLLTDSGICAIFGRSGAGKTTLINLIAGIDTPSTGHISTANSCFYDSDKNINLATHQREIGYVFQQARLFPHYSVQKNLTYGYQKKQDPNTQFFQQVIALLDIQHLLNRYPKDLSGGEMQRVAIGRALLRKPKLLLMDEPLASLDIPRKLELLPYLEKLNKVLKLPILYVTHSLDEVLFLADQILLIEKGQLILQGDIEAVWNNPLMQPWLNQNNHCAIMHTKVTKQHASYPLTALDLGGQTLWIKQISQEISSKVRVRIFAKDVSLTQLKIPAKDTSIRNILDTKVIDIIVDKNDVRIKLQLADNILWADITLWALDDLQLEIGQQIFAQIKGVSINHTDLANI
jgi:molybdate transport system ATP-binding protein